MSDEMNQTVVSSGPNKKVLYIIVGVVAVLVVLGIFAWMSGLMAMRTAGVQVQPGFNGSATYTTEDGTVTVGANKMPDNWPADVPANYSGATIQYSGSSNPQTGHMGSAVVYVVQASATTVADYYKTQLTAQGWKIQSNANMGATSVVSAEKDGRIFGLSVTDAGNGTAQVSAGLNI